MVDAGPHAQGLAHLAGDRLGLLGVALLRHAEALVEDVGVLIEHGRQATVDAVGEDVLPVRRLLASRLDQAHHLGLVEEVAQGPGDRGGVVADVELRRRSRGRRDSAQGAERARPQATHRHLSEDLDQVLGSPAQASASTAAARCEVLVEPGTRVVLAPLRAVAELSRLAGWQIQAPSGRTAPELPSTKSRRSDRRVDHRAGRREGARPVPDLACHCLSAQW